MNQTITAPRHTFSKMISTSVRKSVAAMTTAPDQKLQQPYLETWFLRRNNGLLCDVRLVSVNGNSNDLVLSLEASLDIARQTYRTPEKSGLCILCSPGTGFRRGRFPCSPSRTTPIFVRIRQTATFPKNCPLAAQNRPANFLSFGYRASHYTKHYKLIISLNKADDFQFYLTRFQRFFLCLHYSNNVANLLCIQRMRIYLHTSYCRYN